MTSTLEPAPGLPDMAFAANGGISIGNKAMAARFTHPERHGESTAYLSWFTATGRDNVVQAAEFNEGEGDFVLVGGISCWPSSALADR